MHLFLFWKSPCFLEDLISSFTGNIKENYTIAREREKEREKEIEREKEKERGREGESEREERERSYYAV